VERLACLVAWRHRMPSFRLFTANSAKRPLARVARCYEMSLEFGWPGTFGEGYRSRNR
jgi:hypothetical protein